MKEFKSICLLVAFGLLLIGCTKMDHLHKGYLEDGETTYVGKVDSIKVYPGHERIKLSWKLNPDPAVSYAWIYWTAEGILDSAKVNFDRTLGVDTAFIVIDDLDEGDYVFNIYTHDKHGNKSVKTEKGGKVYGERYINYLIPTNVARAEYKDGNYQISWLQNTDTTAIGSIVHFTNNEGKASVYKVGAKETTSIISNIDYTKQVSYQTLYKPNSMAIDTFKTAALNIKAVISAPNLIKSDAWQNLLITAGVTFTRQVDGSYIVSGGSPGHAGLFQAVDVTAGVPYTIDMHVEGRAATNTWFEVFLGTATPVQGAEYSSGGNRIGLSTWTSGCAINMGSYSGRLSAIRCVGSGNRVTFPQSGKVYFVIRTGGANLGSGGIKISNIELRGPDLNL